MVYKTPTPVAENAAAMAMASRNNNLDPYSEDGDEDSLPENYINSLKLNALIGLIVLLVVTAVGTAMLLSISKIWGNHRENVWIDNSGSFTLSNHDYIERISPRIDLERSHHFIHSKDLSTFLFQYEMNNRKKQLKKKAAADKSAEETTTPIMEDTEKNSDKKRPKDPMIDFDIWGLGLKK